MKKIQKLLSVVLVTVLLFTGIPMTNFGSMLTLDTSAFTLSTGHKLYEDFIYSINTDENGKGESITVVYYKGDDKNIVIPEKIEDLPVKEIGASAFDYTNVEDGSYNNSRLQYIESIEIPETVEYIGDNAFYLCERLEEVTLPSSVRFIGYGAFRKCKKLKNLNIGNKVESIGEYFIQETVIEDITIPGGEGAELEISSYAFEKSVVENITIQSDFIKLNDYSFSNANGTLKNVTLEGEVVYCGSRIFGKEADGFFPEKFILKDNFIGTLYENVGGYYIKKYVDNWENTGWTVFFDVDSEAGWLKDGYYRYFLSNDKAVIAEYTNTDETGNLLLPQTLGGKEVVAIAYGAFKNKKMTEVTIPQCIIEIGAYAFYNCTKLTKVNYDTSERIFRTAAFAKCSKLEKFTFPESITEIPDGIFQDCFALKTVVAKGAKIIGDSSFRRCTSLETVSFSPELQTVKAYGFYSCAGLESIGVNGEKITEIGEYAFGLSAIKSFVFSDEITAIPENCFYRSEVTNVLIPEGIKEIGKQAFFASSITTFDFPDTLTVIGDGAFTACENITKLDLPKSLKKIGESAFGNSRNISGTLRLENNIEYIGDGAFGNAKLTKLYYNVKKLEKYDANDVLAELLVFSDINFNEIEFGNDVESIPRNIFANQTKIKEITIPESVTFIDKRAFMNCTALKTVSLPDSLKEIEVQAFYGCTSIEEFAIPKGVENIYETAIPPKVKTIYFNAENCSFGALKKDEDQHELSPFANRLVEKIVIGDTVKRIPDYFLANCDFLESITIPDSVTEIGKSAFAYSEIENIYLPDTIISIEDSAFTSAVTNITRDFLPISLRMLGADVFKECTAVTEIYIPDSVVYIGESAFANCYMLTSVRMSSNVKYIMESAFAYCCNLSDFEWEADVKLIGHKAFGLCSSLSEFDFRGVELLYPNSFDGTAVRTVMLGETKTEEASELISVDEQSFKNCTELESVSVGGNVTTIKSEAFAECDSLETAVISDSVVNIANDAFEGCDLLTICCAEDSYAHEYAVKNDIPVTTFIIAPIPNQVYTGDKIEPDVDVSMTGKNLAENADFSVKYADNINVGIAKVTVKGKGLYKALTSIANFTIITKDISGVTVTPTGDQNYTGEAITPTLTITDGGNLLKEGSDYTVTYKNNIEVGTATVTIKGTGNYSGTTTAEFNIKQQTFWERIVTAFTAFFAKIKAWFVSIFS